MVNYSAANHLNPNHPGGSKLGALIAGGAHAVMHVHKEVKLSHAKHNHGRGVLPKTARWHNPTLPHLV